MNVDLSVSVNGGEGAGIGGFTCAGVRALVEGEAQGATLVLSEPLSFWGGVDPETGEIIDRRHPQRGQSVRGKVLVLPAGRGSSSSSSVLAECVRAATAPAAILLREPDAILLLGALVARELYGSGPPVLVLAADDFARLRSDEHVRVAGVQRTE